MLTVKKNKITMHSNKNVSSLTDMLLSKIFDRLAQHTVFREGLSRKMPLFEATLIILGAVMAWYA